MIREIDLEKLSSVPSEELARSIDELSRMIHIATNEEMKNVLIRLKSNIEVELSCRDI